MNDIYVIFMATKLIELGERKTISLIRKYAVTADSKGIGEMQQGLGCYHSHQDFVRMMRKNESPRAEVR